MIDFFYKIYSLFFNRNIILDKLKINSIFRRLITLLANIFIPIVFNFNKNSLKYRIRPSNDKHVLIASLTSFPTRIDRIWIVIESILRQTVKPDRLMLWLSKEQFPNMECLPPKLIKLQERGLEIILCEGDLRSHKKYYYVIKKYPEADLFTFDDDIMYPSNAIESVITIAKKNPNCVVGRYCNHLMKNDVGDVCFSRDYREDFVNIPRSDTFIGSGGGTLYPSGSLPSIAQDFSVFMSVCRTADDVWLNTMCRFAGYKVVATQKSCPLIEVKSKNNITLFEVNYGAENLRQFKAVREYCKLNGKDPYENL